MSQDGIDSVIGKKGLFMCRIASFFLLQRLKGSMSGDAHDFNNIGSQAVIKFFFLQSKAPKEIHAFLTETFCIHIWIQHKKYCYVHLLKFVGQKNLNFVDQIFWDQDGILLIDYLPKGQTINTEYYLSLLVRSPRQSCSCTTMPQLTGHLQPRRNWPTWASNVLITHPVLQIWPRWTTTCFWTEKTIERLPFLVRRRGHCCRRDLVGRTTFWISFEWLA